MHHTYMRIGSALAVLSFLAVAGCTPSASGAAKAPLHSVAGGCSGTVVTDSVPPMWAQTGWTHTNGAPWPTPWALGTGGTAVAFVFAGQLVAGTSPRADGTNNKILWLVKDNPSSSVIDGRPLGQSQPVVRILGGPSIVDVPTAGCWTFRVAWGARGENASTVNLQVLPAGTLPPR